MAGPSFTVGMIAFNCARWLPATLAQVAFWADRIIVVHGCTPEMVQMGLAHASGDSIDDTSEVLGAQALLYPNLEIVEAGVQPHRNALRNLYLSRCVTDWLLVLDHDEFYAPESLELIKAEAENASRICIASRWHEYYLWTRRYEQDGPPMERIVRLEQGMEYPDLNSGQFIVRRDGSKIWSQAHYRPEIICHHYNRVLDPGDLALKLAYYANRDLNQPLCVALRTPKELIALRKSAGGGVFVPLADQPPAARNLLQSEIAPLGSCLALLDIKNGGFSWQT